jgi:hypothetical protein
MAITNYVFIMTMASGGVSYGLNVEGGLSHQSGQSIVSYPWCGGLRTTNSG